MESFYGVMLTISCGTAFDLVEQVTFTRSRAAFEASYNFDYERLRRHI